MNSNHSIYIPYEGPFFEALHSNVKEIYRIAINHYGVDRVCLNREKDAHISPESDSNTLKLVLSIYYPEVNITNSANRVHTIKELYVKIQLHNDGSFISKFKIHRTYLSEAEVRCRYIHSHVLPKRYNDIIGTEYHGCNNVCLGSGEIESTLSLLYEGFNRDYFDLFLYQLDTFVAWESLEGGPYQCISSLYTDNESLSFANMPTKEYNLRVKIINLCRSDLSTIYSNIIKEAIKDPNLELGVVHDNLGNVLRVVINNSFFEFQSILSHTKQFRRIATRDLHYLSVILSSDLTKASYCSSVQPQPLPFIDREIPVLYFKGLPKYMRIEENTIDVDNKIYSIKQSHVYTIKYIMEKYINKQICK